MLNKLFPNNRLIKAEDLKKTWRIILMVIIGQVIGLLIGLVFSLHADKLLSLWIGGAIGTLPGFIVGIIWYFKSQKKNDIPYFTISFFAIGAILLPIMAFGLLSDGLEFKSLKEKIKTINASDIEKIVIYKGYHRKNII